MNLYIVLMVGVLVTVGMLETYIIVRLIVKPSFFNTFCRNCEVFLSHVSNPSFCSNCESQKKKWISYAIMAGRGAEETRGKVAQKSEPLA